MLPVLITYCNFGYIDFAKNLILNLANVLKNHKLHFYCLDMQIYDELSKTPHEFMTLQLFEQDVSSDFEVYNSKKYNELTHTKTIVLRDALNRYPFIHFIDCDVVCLKEPTIDHYYQYSSCDIVFQYDYYYDKLPEFYFKTWQCTGNMSLRRTPGTFNFIDNLELTQLNNTTKNDQDCLLTMFKLSKITDIRKYKSTRLFVYPPEEYTNGSWKGDMSNTYFFHANHVVGKEDKINLLKKIDHWFL